MKDLNEMTSQEMVDEFNKLTGQNIKKFSDKKTAAKRLAEARASGKPPAKAKRGQKPGVKTGTRQHHNVIVQGQRYRSVAQAFKELGLPMGKHVKFRGELFEKGELTFTHEGIPHKFKLAD